MSGGESYPERPGRVSAFVKLESLPKPGELLSGHQETTIFTYSQDSEGYAVAEDPVQHETPFTVADSGQLRQIPLPEKESMRGSEAHWMSAEEVAEYMRRAEEEAERLAEVEFGIEGGGRDDVRRVSVSYEGPDARFKLKLEEGVGGSKIEHILGAVAGMATSPAVPAYGTPVAPAPSVQYLGRAQAPAEIAAPLAYLPADVANEEYAATVDVDAVEVDDQPATALTFFDQVAERQSRASAQRTPAESNNVEARKGMSRNQRNAVGWVIGLTGLVICLPTYGPAAYEVARQAVKGDMITGVEAFELLRGQEINKEKE